VAESGNGVPHRDVEERTERASGRAVRIRAALSFKRISALYVGVALFILFSIEVPHSFLTVVSLKTLLDEQAVTGLLAVAIVVPLAAGVYDLSVGYAVGFATVFVSWLIVTVHVPVVPAILLTIGGALMIGAFNGVVVVHFKINSFIGTLATGSLLSALALALSNNQEIVGLPNSFLRLGTIEAFGLGLPVYIMIVVAIVLWYVLQYTPTGRYVYATGGSPEVARLAGVRTGRIMFSSYFIPALAAGLSGIVLTALLSTGTSDTGPSYLLPVYAAVFLGSTQIKPGQFNIWGTVIAVYVLGLGVQGFQLMGAQVWLPDAFNGAALLLAVGLAGKSRTRIVSKRRKTSGGPADDLGTLPAEPRSYLDYARDDVKTQASGLENAT
jgi:ribose transport system permease protein